MLLEAIHGFLAIPNNNKDTWTHSCCTWKNYFSTSYQFDLYYQEFTLQKMNLQCTSVTSISYLILPEWLPRKFCITWHQCYCLEQFELALQVSWIDQQQLGYIASRLQFSLGAVFYLLPKYSSTISRKH